MPILFNPNKKKGFFRIPVGGTQAVSCAFSYSAASYTDADPDPTPTVTGTSGGTFTSTAGIVINADTGEIDLSASAVNTYVITYTVRGKACTQSVEITASFANTYSINFDGVDDFVSVYDGASGSGPFLFTASDDFSFSVWIKTSSASTTNYIFSMRGTSLIWFYTTQSGGNIRFAYYLRDNSSNFYAGNTINTPDGYISADTWTNVLFTRNGTTKDINLYLDGASAQVTKTDTTSDDFTDYDKISIGNDDYGAGRYWFDGNIDEVALFDSDQSGNAVTIYNSGTPSDLTSLSPVGWWRMGENGSFKSTQWLLPIEANKDNVSNYSMVFDGVDDTIDIGTASMGITTAISVSAWVKIPVTDTGGGGTNIRMITCEDAAGGADRNWLLYWRGTGYNYFRAGIFHTDGSSTAINSTGITPNDGNWHHVMLTFDGTTDANGLKLYVDGTLFQATAGSTGTRSTASVEPAIGSLTAGGGWFFEGNIDEVSVFDAVKVVADVSDGTEPIDVSGDSDLVAYWKLGEEATFSTNWTVPDSSPNSNTGTSANMTIEDRIGDAPNSTSNAVSLNMVEADREEETP